MVDRTIKVVFSLVMGFIFSLVLGQIMFGWDWYLIGSVTENQNVRLFHYQLNHVVVATKLYSFILYIVGSFLIYQLIRFRFPNNSTFIRGFYLWGISMITFGDFIDMKLVLYFSNLVSPVNGIISGLQRLLMFLVVSQIIAFTSDKVINKEIDFVTFFKNGYKRLKKEKEKK